MLTYVMDNIDGDEIVTAKADDFESARTIMYQLAAGTKRPQDLSLWDQSGILMLWNPNVRQYQLTPLGRRTKVAA